MNFGSVRKLETGTGKKTKRTKKEEEEETEEVVVEEANNPQTSVTVEFRQVDDE